jgi:glycosyltransferase involved in cell wall biosynthesis
MTKPSAVKTDPDLSVVIPLYNEGECIRLLYTSLKAICDGLGLNYELIFIDDGSTDATYRLLADLHRQDPTVRVITLRRNYGQTPAMAAGFAYAKGQIIVSMDGDLQNDPADIPRLLSKVEEGYDVVCGWRKDRQDTFWTRRLPSVVANWIIGRMTGVRVHDNGCSLKAYRASVIKNVALYGEMHRFIPAMSTLAGARITEIMVKHHPRRLGRSKYGLGRTWRVALDIITVKMITSLASRPAQWFGLLSLVFILIGSSILSIVAGMYFNGFMKGWLVFPAVALLLFFLSGHFLILGIIGELFVKTEDCHSKKSLHPIIILP